MDDKDLDQIRQQRLAQMESQYVSIDIFIYFCFLFVYLLLN